MAEPEQDHLSDMLHDGWVIVGYSTAMMAAGAMVHSILMQRDADVSTVNIIKTSGKEIGRTLDNFSPRPPPQKKGWLG